MLERWSTITADPAETRALGRRLGQLARPGLVVLLAGELGAGKTCFAQGVAEGLGVPVDSPVTSPSYTLLNIHQGRLPLHHFDLYRLTTVEDLEDLGYDEIAEGGGVTLVEWADRLSTPLPASLRIILVRIDALRRELCFEAGDTFGMELVAVLAKSANTL
ncbi:MAG: tRNA (adenosine(37)-N6)-threonylcarbamoyltransferase complex ATPase subunit type 1 TsaE [Desulfuromonadales bacterium]|nr:tRNA (adenosine(37)-N6)-threonylcarbamoyltransferase complex ATPase subunit type 1 TsaE [Desulfuromonadales bacterium]